MKICYNCNIIKDENEFDKKPNSSRGVKKYCKQCSIAMAAHHNNFKKRNPERYKEIQRKKDRKSRSLLENSYIRKFLRVDGLDNEVIFNHPELIEHQRKILLTKRSLKNFKHDNISNMLTRYERGIK